MTFDRNEAIRFGWNTIKTNLVFFITILIITGIFQFIPEILSKFMPKATKDNLIIIMIFFLLILIFLVINMITSLGLIKISLKFTDSERPQIGDLFSCAPFLLKYILSSILYSLIVCIGFILLVVPGIILAVRFHFYNYFIVDIGASPVEALKRSYLLTKGNTWNLFIFGAITVIINILGALALVIGLFVSIPVTMLAYAFVYRQLLAESGEIDLSKLGRMDYKKENTKRAVTQATELDMEIPGETNAPTVQFSKVEQDMPLADIKEDSVSLETAKEESSVTDAAPQEAVGGDKADDSKKAKKKNKEKKERSGFKLPSKVEIFSKIGLSRTGELIGFDIGTSSIKVSALKKTKEGFKLTHLAKKSYKENLLSDGNIIDYQFVAQEIKNIMSANKIKSSIAACALSSYSVITKKAKLPLLEEKSVEKAIKLQSDKSMVSKKFSLPMLEDMSLIEAEIENVIPFPLKEINYSFDLLGIDEEDEKLVNILIVAAKKEIVEGFVNAFRTAGLNLVLLDIDIFALVNLVEQIYGINESSVLIVDIGASIMNMAIVKGENIEFTREILLGGKYLTEQIEKTARITYEEAEEKKIKADPEIMYLFEDFIFNISSEINKTINFYFSTKPNENINKIYLTGGCSLLTGLKEKINEDTNIEVEIIDPFMLVGGGKEYFEADLMRADIYKDYKEFNGISMQLSTRIDEIVR